MAPHGEGVDRGRRDGDAVSFFIKIDDRAVKKALAALEPKARRKAETNAMRKGAAFLKPLLAAAIPPNFKRAKKAVYRGTARRDKPGAFVSIRGGKKGAAGATNRAFYRSWMESGTKDRFTKSGHAFRGHEEGVHPVGHTYEAHGDAAAEIAAAELARLLEL